MLGASVSRHIHENPLLKIFFIIDETKPIHKNVSFWASVMFFPFVAILFSLPIMVNETSGICFSSECYEYFYRTFTFPLWISTGSLVFGVMYTRLHSSKQNAAKLALEYREETYKRYFDHRDRIFSYGKEYLKLREEMFKHSFKSFHFDFDRFYKAIYPNNSPSKGFSFESTINGGDYILEVQIQSTKFLSGSMQAYREGSILENNGVKYYKAPDQYVHSIHAYIHSFAYKCFLSIVCSENSETIRAEGLYSTGHILIDFLHFMFERCELDVDEEKLKEARKGWSDMVNSNTQTFSDVSNLVTPDYMKHQQIS